MKQVGIAGGPNEQPVVGPAGLSGRGADKTQIRTAKGLLGVFSLRHPLAHALIESQRLRLSNECRSQCRELFLNFEWTARAAFMETHNVSDRRVSIKHEPLRWSREVSTFRRYENRPRRYKAAAGGI
jgi:hypothetical protein